MLRAWFDESGLNPHERICSVAGLVGTEDAWKSLEHQWIAQRQELEIEYFHMTDCESRQGQFILKEEPICKYAVKRFASIIAEHEVQPIFGSIPWEDWDAMSGPDVTKFKQIYKKPFALAFEHCVHKLIEWSHVHADDEPVEVMFSEQKEFEATAREIFAAYKGSEFWGERLAAIAFGNMRKFAPLQSADMIAYDVNKYWDYLEYGTVEEWNKRELINRLFEKGRLRMGGMFTAKALELAAQRFAQVGMDY